MTSHRIKSFARRAVFVASAAVGVQSASIASADVKLPALFSDHMVLQRDAALPVWGWASPGEKVTITLGVASASTTAAADGKWSVRLAAQAMSSKPMTLNVTGQNHVLVQDVVLGDVWLCGGQSNMGVSLAECKAPADVRDAQLPMIRGFRVDEHFASTPQDDVRGKWTACSPETAAGFPAVAFYFARKIHGETGVPIGLLCSSVGGTNVELWISQETFYNTPALASYARMMRESLELYQQELASALPTMEQWTATARAAKLAGQPIPTPPTVPAFPFSDQRMRPRCVELYNGMIAPLIPFALRGAIWYQGENNAGNAADAVEYIEKMRALIGEWRQKFENPAMPFYFVQLAAWQNPSNDPAGGLGYAHVRDAQRKCLAIPNTGMAVAIDIGDVADIHPKDKFDVGERLARWALAKQYGKTMEPSGPIYRDLRIHGDVAKIEFDHVGSGLMVGMKDGREPVSEDKTQNLHRFAIAGADKQWHWAEATIEGNSVVCRSPLVPHPTAVRYAFDMNPAGANLYNREGLPASPFRTDNW